MIGTVVRFRKAYGDGGVAQRFKVQAVGFAPADNNTADRFYILGAELTDGQFGELHTLSSDQVRVETLTEERQSRKAEPYEKPPPTSVPGPGERGR